MQALDTVFAEIKPKILYFGTPVVLLSTRNEDGTPNLAPMSSCWTLGCTAVLGLTLVGKTMENLRRERECVLNVPGPEIWRAVERLAPLTGKCPVPESKAAQFRFEPDKFGASGLTPIDSEVVAPPRVLECPLQMEARVCQIWEMTDAKLSAIGGAATVEVSVLRIHARQDIVVGDRYIDPARWQPLIYNFRHYFSLGEDLGRTFRAEI
ncbi:MAG TPA: flavin reductase family protein [Candidatus Bathyarchaeia archaeon]|jgi:flavin reductase (DIM6/NTAB) family NADH-FMN oxidoreductase RutF|nr:flavin reductase family protein [Candidatus Bathyarchaeia archaeon]